MTDTGLCRSYHMRKCQPPFTYWPFLPIDLPLAMVQGYADLCGTMLKGVLFDCLKAEMEMIK